MRKWAKLVLAVAAVAMLAGCSAKAGAPAAAAITLNIANTAYGTREITVEKGKTYQLVLENQDVQLHDFSIDKIDAKVQEAKEEHGHDMGAKKPDLHISADAGKTGTLTFTPNQQGTFTYYCSVEGHKEAGMSGKLIVK
ncbi:MAG TPA: cupredoxin domain-containing protein [Symbiobacteriaceae bacterium]|nr:cupredoxin domain-containing protein [Symbiobacteriaceae bacterium]